MKSNEWLLEITATQGIVNDDGDDPDLDSSDTTIEADSLE